LREKKILMMINFFPPAGGGGVYRPLGFVKNLVRFGWDVTVVTPRPGEFWISDPDLASTVPGEVTIVRTPSLSGFRMLSLARGRRTGRGSARSSHRFEWLRRLSEFFMLPDTYVGWIPFARRAAMRLCSEQHFDILYSTSPPDSTHMAAWSVARRHSLPWLADCRDPWISLYLRDPPTALHRRLHERLEDRLSNADRILVTTAWQEEMMRRRFPGSRLERIANGYDEDDFEGIDELRPPQKPFTIMHCGMMTLGRSSRPILEGLREVFRREPGARDSMRILFLGARESENEAWVHRLGLDDVAVFMDNVAHHECVKLERKSHVLLLVKHDDERYRGLVPGKVYEYIGARRPILAVVPEGEAADIVRRNNRGEVARIDDPGGVADAILKMFRLYREGDLESSYSLDSLPHYSRRAGTERLVEILSELLEEG
jgi:glycosyltransferase involved in cell wall biosynthesis